MVFFLLSTVNLYHLSLASNHYVPSLSSELLFSIEYSCSWCIVISPPVSMYVLACSSFDLCPSIHHSFILLSDPSLSELFFRVFDPLITIVVLLQCFFSVYRVFYLFIYLSILLLRKTFTNQQERSEEEKHHHASLFGWPLFDWKDGPSQNDFCLSFT